MKPSLISKTSTIYLLLFLSIFTCAEQRTMGQATPSYDPNDVVYDRSTDQLLNYPRTVNRRQTVRVIIINVNNIMYEYRIEVTAIPRAINDWGQFNNSITRSARQAAAQGVRQVDACTIPLSEATSALTALKDQLGQEEALPIYWYNKGQMAAPDKSYTLAESLKAWNENVAPKVADLRAKATALEALADQGKCTSSTSEIRMFIKSFNELNDVIKRIEDKVNSSHVAEVTTVLQPDNDYSVTVREFFQTSSGKLTEIESGKRTFKFSPVSNILTLSVGPLFSTIQDRAYDPRKSPTSTENVLVVEGNSKLRPEGVALLNYMLPRLDNDTFGLALSAGPVIRFGSKSDLATLGFFTGFSVNLYRRLYITPGFHTGEFADFPVGFSNGQAVPANFGELTPVKRWTTRFAFAISFQTTSFGNLGGEASGQPEVTGGEGDKGKGDKNGKGGKQGTNNQDNNFNSPLDSKSQSQLAAHALLEDELRQLRLIALDSKSLAPTLNLPSRNIVSLRNTETSNGTRLTISADIPIYDYRTYLSNGRFYLVIPRANLLKQDALSGNSFTEAKIERVGADLVLIFVLKNGTRVSVEEKFNRLNLVFISPAVETK